ncbi:hypothetical protein L1887_33852 [Cichorium endivia]|nr:hypothetical protein L1887_33852 [Cichorium endivia]
MGFLAVRIEKHYCHLLHCIFKPFTISLSLLHSLKNWKFRLTDENHTINCPFAFINSNRPQIPYLYHLPVAYFDLELGLNHLSPSPLFLQPPVTSPWPGNLVEKIHICWNHLKLHDSTPHDCIVFGLQSFVL